MPVETIPCRPESVVAPNQQQQFRQIYEEFYAGQNSTAKYSLVPSATLYVEQFERVKSNKDLHKVPTAENNRFDVSKYLTRSRDEWTILEGLVSRSRQREAERLFLSRQSSQSRLEEFSAKLRPALIRIELFFSLVRCEFQMARAVLSR